MEIQTIKQRFGIIGNSVVLNRAIDVAIQVAPVDLSVLITGESGVGKEVFPQIIHQYSSRKHGTYIAVNCGAIPEGTIDSELFGHEKGSFTGAYDSRKGYFEVASGGTIFLDEVAELPVSTQVRLLRVLETGEFLKVGSSKEGKFREDLFYRLNTVPIDIPSLRERKEDIPILFRKFALDFAERNRMPAITLTEDAIRILVNYRWPGNIRQLKNITEQISVIEQNREITADKLRTYLPDYYESKLPALFDTVDQKTFASEREILYKILFDLKNDVSDMKKLVLDIMQRGTTNIEFQKDNARLLKKLYDIEEPVVTDDVDARQFELSHLQGKDIQDTEEIVEESLSLEEKEKELIKKALDKHKGKRKYAASELGISERTLYRKIKEYNI
jgi:transcriptional regulator with PAS, ATPase and Fis domain